MRGDNELGALSGIEEEVCHFRDYVGVKAQFGFFEAN